MFFVIWQEILAVIEEKKFASLPVGQLDSLPVEERGSQESE